jgi:hypothetical protein
MKANLQVVASGTKKPPKRKAPSKKVAKAITKVSPEKYAVAATTIALLIVSLVHLVDGMMILTDCPMWQAVGMGIGVDAMFVACEWSMLRQGADKYGNALVAMTLIASAGLNSLAFAHGQFDLVHIPAVLFGLFIPAALFCATHRLAKLK